MKLRKISVLGLSIGSALLSVLLVNLGLAMATNAPHAGSGSSTAFSARVSYSSLPAMDGLHTALAPNLQAETPKPPDLHAQAWKRWFTLDPDTQAKVDPRLLDEFQGDVVPTHLRGQPPEAGEILGIDKTRFLVYLHHQPSLTSLEDRVFASAAEQRHAVVDILLNATNASQAPLRNLLDSRMSNGGVDGYQPFHIVNALAVEGDLMTIIELARRDDVAHIDANYPLQPLWVNPQQATPASATSAVTLQKVDPATAFDHVTSNWNIEKVEADRVWSQLAVRGAGAVVAGFDTGVGYNHPALADKYRGFVNGGYDHNYNWFQPDGSLHADGNYGASLSSQPYDCDFYGTHGTHTMGTMVGDGGTAETRIGMAPEAKWIAVPGICNGTMSGMQGDDIGGIKAFQWLLCPTDLTGDLSTADCSMAPDVINNSWGSANPTNEVFRPIIRALRAAGIAPVFAAGNPTAGEGSIGTPANAPEAITVGATDYLDEVAWFSGRGPSFYEGEQKPELSAPGVDVLSSVGETGDGYYTNSGTSMAAPHVAGLIALLVSADLRDGVRDFSVDEFERFMTYTADDLGEPGADNDFGFGRINAYHAVRWALSAGNLTGVINDRNTGAPVNATMTGVNGSADARFSTKAAASGAYSATVPGGAYRLEFDAWGYESAVVEGQQVFANANSVVDFSLDPLPRRQVTGQVNGDGVVAGATVFVQDHPDSRTLSGADGTFTLDLPVGVHELVVEAVGYRRTGKTVTIVDSDASVTFALESAPKILLVDADARYGWFIGWPVHTIFDWALEQHGYTRDLWHIQYATITDTETLEDGRIGYGLPSLATLQQYDVVIWSNTACFSSYLGCVRALGEIMTDRLAAYLDEGGRMILSGQDIAYFDDGTEFFDNYVRADILNDFAAGEGDTLSGAGFFEDLDLEITNASVYGHANGAFYLSPDSVTPQGEIEYVGPDEEQQPDPPEPGVSYPLMTYDLSGGAAVLASVPCVSDYRLIFYPVAYENIGPRADQRGPEIAETLQRSLEWLMATRPAISVVPTLNRTTMTTAPNSHVTYLLDLINEGDTAVKVTVAVDQGNWSTKIISGNVPIDGSIVVPPCGYSELRIRVTVPENVRSGATDRTRISVQVEGGESSQFEVETVALRGWSIEPPQAQSRWSHSTASLPGDRYVYAIGGYVSDSDSEYYDYRAVASAQRYDVCRQEWTSIADMVLPRISGTAVAVDDKIFLIGGYTIDSIWEWTNVTDSLIAYDPATDSWQELSPLPTPLAGVAAAAYGNKIFVFGGGGYYLGTNTALVYDTETDDWQTIAPLPGPPRVFGSAAEYNGLIYVAGDYYGTRSTYVYNPETNEWSETAELPVSRGRGSLVSSPDGYLYFVGGASYYSWLGSRVDRYNPATDQWDLAAPLNDSARWDAGGAFAGGRVYVIGGRGAVASTESLPTADAFCRSGKLGPAAVLAGSRITYTIDLQPDVQNVSGVQVLDRLPAETRFIEVGGGIDATYDKEAHTVSWRGSVPAGGDGIQIPIVVQVLTQSDQAIDIGALITNTVTISAEDIPKPGESIQFTRVVTSTVVLPDFANSVKRVEPDRAVSGDLVTYTIDLRSVTPAGDFLTMEDALPPTLEFQPGSLVASTGAADYDAASRTIAWEGAVAPAQNAYFNLDTNYAWGDVNGDGTVPDVDFAWTDISASGTSLGGGDDVLRCGTPIGFDFPFYSDTFDELCVSTNGFVTFDVNAYSARVNACPISGSYAIESLIAAVWDDLVVDDAIYYQSFGQEPERYLIVQWKDARPWRIYNRGYTNFQLVLHENGAIDMNILTMGGEDGSRSTTGLFDYNALESVTYACNVPRSLRNSHTVRFMPPGGVSGNVGVRVRFNATAGEDIDVNQVVTNTVVIRTSAQSYTRTATTLINPMSLDTSTVSVDRADVVPGEFANYRILLTNIGLVPARNASLTGKLPASVQATSTTPTCTTGTCSVIDGMLTWRGVVAPDEPVVVTLEVMLKEALPDGTTVPLQLTLDDGHGGVRTLEASFSVIRSNLAQTKLYLQPAFVEPGRRAEVVLFAYNSGRLATEARAEINLPSGPLYATSGPTCGRGECKIDNGVLTWQGTVEPRDIVQIRISATIPVEAQFGTVYPLSGTIEDQRWGDIFQFKGSLTVAHNTYLPRMLTPDIPENQIYLPMVR